MVPCHDPLESFWNSVHALESGLHRAARDLEHHWQHHQRLQHPHQSWAGDGKAVRFLHPSSAKKRRKDVVADAEEGPSSAGMGWFPMKSFMGSGGSRCRELPVRRKAAPAVRRGDGKEDDSCSGCMNFLTAWSLLLSGISQAFPNPFKSVRKCFQKQFDEKDAFLKPLETKPRLKEPSRKSNVEFRDEKTATSMEKKHEVLPLDLLLCYVIDTVVHSLHLFDQSSRDEEERSSNHRAPSPSTSQFDHMKVISGIIKGKKADVDSFLLSMRFARVGGAPPSLVDLTSSVKDETQDHPADANNNREEPETNSVQKISSGLLNIPLSNVERLRSTLSTVSLTELIEHIPQLVRAPKDHPDKKKLISVQDFFRYTEVEGRRFFEELDRDGDGQVTLEDLELAMRKRKLPRKYAKDFFRRTRSHLFSKSFGWKQFLSLIKLKDPTILRAYTTLCLSKSGTLQKNQIVTSLRSAGLPANEDNAAAMMRYLVADSGGSISYSHFRNFMLLLPSERLEEDPRSIWFEAATVVAVPPPVEIPAENVLKSALAGGLACALSTSLMHPVDTMKTRVQASTLSFPELVAKLPQIGIQGLYRGSIPAIIGQFSSHGLRTGIFEATKLVLVNVAPTLPDIQVQSLASFCSTILGTAVRIPCEVLKQRLQAGIFDNVGEAIVGTIRQDGFKGFFRGTGATLCREVPFYVAGMGLYAEAKKATQNLLDRDLEPWETIVVGALSGGLAAVVTTPFDVMKTRMMTAPQGLPVSMSMVAFSILRQEGPLGLFKGAVPRFFWIAPLGAMNFAGYELAKKAMMDKPEQQGLSGELLQEKKMSNSG